MRTNLNLLTITPSAARVLKTAALLLYAAMILSGVVHHVPWQDEADAWVTARSLSAADAVDYFRLSGHPPLWYLVLLPFARAGFPPETLQAAGAAFAIGSAWLILFRCPLWWPLRLAFLITIAMAYQYTVMARGYALMIFMLFAINALHPRRMEKPLLYALLLALLWQTEVHAFGAAGILSLLFAYDLCRQRQWRMLYAMLAMSAASMLLVAALLWPVPASINHWTHHPVPLNILSTIQGSFMPEMPFTYALGIVPLLLWIGWQLKNRRGMAVYAVTLLWLLFVHVFIYCALHHLYMLAPLWMFAAWFSATDRPDLHAANESIRWNAEFPMAILFALQAPVTLDIYQHTFATPFSGARDMAAYMREHHLEQEPVALAGCFGMVSVTYYFPHTDFWFAAQNRTSPYMLLGTRYDECRAMPIARMMHNIQTHFPKGTLVLADRKRPLPVAPAGYRLQLLHASMGSAESYYLYRLTPAH